MQPDNRRCWPDVWGQRLSRQERVCLHFFRNSFHSPLSRTLDDINIMCLVISSAFGDSGVSGCTSQECGLSVLLWALVVRYLPCLLHHPRPRLFCPLAIPTGQRKLSRVHTLVHTLVLGSIPAREHPNAFLKVRFASPGGDCPHEMLNRELSYVH